MVYQPIFDHSKNVSGIIVIINDVTEHVNNRKLIAASKNIYHDLIFSMALSILTASNGVSMNNKNVSIIAANNTQLLFGGSNFLICVNSLM